MRVGDILHAITNEYCFASKKDLLNQMAISDYPSTKFKESGVVLQVGGFVRAAGDMNISPFLTTLTLIWRNSSWEQILRKLVVGLCSFIYILFTGNFRCDLRTRKSTGFIHCVEGFGKYVFIRNLKIRKPFPTLFNCRCIVPDANTINKLHIRMSQIWIDVQHCIYHLNSGYHAK